ncbi:membrane protein [Lampropedia cohaerens]|uniref:Membrane protein n=1 Tax=Lampropedia cohaerens TaxID=1610491 RepID=A0A0U1Q363_9BURK|nr:DedA family protein [Lampropedia cohaerens]KKW69075.1 membrane protein [Lampropedia cohaerens]
MEAIQFLVEFILHVDQHLQALVANYGAWVYPILFLVVFVETGLVVMPFLPGDSLLFIVGALCGAQLMRLPLAMGLLFAAAFLGDQCNFQIGRYLGPKVFKWESSRLFNRQAFDRTHDFYVRYGAITIVLARFMPFMRTFVPFVAGVAHMHRPRFVTYNLLGAMLWVGSVCMGGYFFGNLPWVRDNLSKIIWGLILVPGLLALVGAWRTSRSEAVAPSSQPVRER